MSLSTIKSHAVLAATIVLFASFCLFAALSAVMRPTRWSDRRLRATASL